MQTELTYRGQGEQTGQHTPPRYDHPFTPADHPNGYVAEDGLTDAVNTAIFLGQPLLLMGEPGTGKTQLAHSLAWELDLPLHKFNTKMNSAGVDLFYRYDSLLHFHDANTLKEINHPSKYVQYAALGKAILFSNGPDDVREYLPVKAWDAHKAAVQSVVLVDEIDKAPRDFPNDILAETERLEFEVKETGWTPIRADGSYRPVVIFTSNQERNLPEAFLRRCVFYYIPFPKEAELRKIVKRRLGGEHDSQIAHFLKMRQDDQLVKKPATAELLSWLRVLDKNKITGSDVEAGSDQVKRSYSALLKNKEDFERLARSSADASNAPR